jgi:hypothetical protein
VTYHWEDPELELTPEMRLAPGAEFTETWIDELRDWTPIQLHDTLNKLWSDYRMMPTHFYVDIPTWRKLSPAFVRREIRRGYPFHPLVLETL